MAASTTRTLNPIHFEDLEPHRFEDLIRQLVYDFRTWKSLQALGRSGADEGMDVLATENISTESENTDENVSSRRKAEERSWIIQCKREKQIGPARLREIVAECLPHGRDYPYGFMVAAACDFSKQTRDAFREEMVERRIGESYLWGKGELEDMLFLPKNDHLLFAYFGISIQVTRRSVKSHLNARLAIKRRLLDVIGGLNGDLFQPKWVFLLDATEERYPYQADIPDFGTFPRWAWFQVDGHHPPNHLCLLVKRHFGVFNPDDETWDSLSDFDHQKRRPPNMEFQFRPDQGFEGEKQRFTERWITTTAHCEDHRCNIDLLRFIHYDRILAVDSDGDIRNPAPHLFIEFDPVNGPFEPREVLVASALGHPKKRLDLSKRIDFFGSRLREIEQPQFIATPEAGSNHIPPEAL